jgi:multidrug resistance efflux pump
LKILGALLAIGVAVVSLVLIAVTQEPKHADSSPGPAVAASVPQIADAKSEAEILFRGKSASILKRTVTIPFTGEITQILVREGQLLNENDQIVEYKLDRQSMNQVHRTLYPETVLNLKKTAYDRKIQLEKLNKVSLPIKKMDLDRHEKELRDLRELQDREMAALDAVKLKEKQVLATKKEVFEIEETIRQYEADLARVNEDLRFFEEKQKRDIELLEWQTHRSYSDSDLPLNVAFLKAPLAGQVIWMAPEIAVKSEVPAGSHVVTVAPNTGMIVRCKVHELDLVRLRTGDRGTAVFDALPDKKYGCKISRIPWVSRNPSLEVPADYELECELESPDLRLKDGLTCNVKISVAQ